MYKGRLCSRHFSWSCLSEKIMSTVDLQVAPRVILIQWVSVTFQYYWGEGLPHDAEERYSTVAVAVAAGSFGSYTAWWCWRHVCPEVLFPLSSTAIGAHGDGRGGRSSCQPWLSLGGMPSFPGALPQARESMALQSSSTEGGTSSSAMTGRGVMISTAVSVTTFSWSVWPRWSEWPGNIVLTFQFANRKVGCFFFLLFLPSAGVLQSDFRFMA